jgi:DNA-3-methyladenine glycosylase
MYHCFNVVTDADGVASGVLIRALQVDVVPKGFAGIPEKKRSRLAAGPGKLCKVLQIDRTLSGFLLGAGQPLRLEHRSEHFQQALEEGTINFVQTTRIGISQGIDLPWRWYVGNSTAVSQL